jgi:serine/threonine-protein kinase
MSLVHRAHDELLDREVAVKILTGADSDGLRTEARAHGRLTSPRVAHIYDCGETDDGAPYLVMELVDGRPLAEDLADGAALPWRRAAGIAGEIAEGLATAHARGLVHRDIKPDNVMLTASGVKLIDFGISAYVGEPDADAAGQLMGTAAYVAPERISDAPVDAPADVYALGVLLYRMLAGRLPYRVADSDLMDAHLHAEPARLPPIPGLPAALSECLAECLAKDPSARPSAERLALDLPRIAVPGLLRPAVAAGSVGLDRPERVAPRLSASRTAASGRAPGRTRTIAVTRAVAVTRTVAVTRAVAAFRAVAPATAPRSARHSRWVAVGFGLAGLTLLVTAWSTGSPRSTGADPVPAAAACRATFAVARDWGAGFDARVTVTNTGTREIDGWRISFDLPEGQHLRASGPTAVLASSSDHATHAGALRQSGTTVVAAGTDPGEPLRPAQWLTVPITGAYTRAAAIPTTVRLNDMRCATTVVGATSGPPKVSPTPKPTADPAPPHDDHHGKPSKSKGGKGHD